MYTTVDDWIQQESIPFSVASPESFNAAIGRVMASLGDSVELLGFGEALHGGEDFLMLRNRLFQRLVETHGYSAIAIESSFPKGYVTNEYVAGHGSAAYDAVKEVGFSPGFGQLEANRELVEWMRQYNNDPAHPVKLHFYGFDSPTEMTYTDSPRQLLTFALDTLSAMDPASGDDYRRRLDPLIGEDAAWTNPAAMMDASQSIGLSPQAAALRVETENLISELIRRRPEFVEKSGQDRYLEAVQFASEARQLLTYHAELARDSEDRIARGLGLRDAIMAGNLAYIVSQERGRGKVFVFAHNSHLQRGKTLWQLGPHTLIWYPAGAHLKVMLGLRYAVIGAALGISPDNGIGQPEAGTLEARLTAIPGPARFIPTHLGHGLPTPAIAALPLRSGSQRNFSYFPLTPQSVTDFDWWVILDSTTYQRGGPPLPEVDATPGG